MTRVGYGDLLKIPNARWGKGGGVTWLLHATFGGGDQSAPLTSPLGTPAVEVGSLTLVQTDGQYSISSNELNFPTQATPNNGDQQVYASALMSRAAGRTFVMRVNLNDVTSYNGFGWKHTTLGGTYLVNNASMLWFEVNTFRYNGGAQIMRTFALNTDYAFAFCLLSAGGMVFTKGGVDATWALLWIDTIGSSANVYPVFSNFNTAGKISLFGVRDLPAPFNTDYGITSQNVASPVSGTSYTATADAITDLTLTAPNPLADQAGYRYRYTDDDNCWHSYLNSAGAYRLDSVAASVATNRVNVAAVIGVGETRTIRTISNGSLHDAYTLASTTWTKRGSQINVSHLNTNTAIRPYVTGSWAMSNLRSYPTTDPRYDAELNKT